ncbi:glycosyltransferase family 2 protein [Jatrophihabitans sp. YIM 134969]
MSPAVAVVVVTYFPGHEIDDLLDSLADAVSEPYEVVLADNGSTDGSVERAATRPGVTLLPTGGNLGYGRAANLGVAATTADHVVIANQDLTWGPGSLDTLLAAARRRPDAVSLGPRIQTAAGVVYPSARDLPDLTTGAGHALFGWWWPGNPWTRRYRREREGLHEREAGWLSGSCLLVRRDAFDAVGGFDPRYFMYFEDVDLGERLGHLGVNLYVPDAVVTHVGGTATGRDPRRMARAHHDSAWLYIQQRYPGPWRRPLRALLHAGLYARAVLAVRSRAVAAGARLAGSGSDAPTDPHSPTPQNTPEETP